MASALTQGRTRSRAADDALEVVFIGNDLGLAELYRLKLELDGYWVSTYPTVDDGLEHIRSRTPDLVFLDLGTDGPGKSQEIGLLRGDVRFRELPLVLLSRGNIQTVDLTAFEVGGRDFLVRVDTVPGEQFWAETIERPVHPRHI